MRITRFRIENYRGLRLAAADDLANRPLILLTGKNGTGKSLVLEALTAAWSGNINLPELVGPYGYSLSIEIGISLEEHEYELVDSWRTARELLSTARLKEHVVQAVSTNREATGFYSQRDELIETLQNPLFAREHPFASIDLLSARRRVSMNTTTAVDLGLLDRTAAADQRRSMYDQEIRWKTAMQMPDVGSYLTSLDYRDYVASRDGIETDNEYVKIQDIFFGASGKKISLPTYDPATTKSTIQVELPSGEKHSLADLSNGEREMLGMLYYVSQLSALGGVLLLDEPEKHLHPTLQLAILKAMMAIASRGQILVVTHAPGLISASPSENVIVVHPAWTEHENQLQRVSDEDEQADVLADLGLTRRDLFQANYLLMVEGPTDEKRLRMLLPDELAGAKVVVAGSRDAVLRTAQSLRGLEVGIPWICVIDRDFLNDQESASLSSDGRVFVWDARMLENVLLETSLLHEPLLPTSISERELETTLGSIVDSLQHSAIEQFIEAWITRYSPTEVSNSGADEHDRVQKNLHAQRSIWERRIQEYPKIREQIRAEIESSWQDRWRYYVDGKRVLGEIQRQFPVFKNISMLIDTLMVRARDREDLMPSDAKRLKVSLQKLQLPSAIPDRQRSISQERDQDIRTALAKGTIADPELNRHISQDYGYSV